MKAKIKASVKSRATREKLPKNVTINPDLNGKYDDQPLFQDKVNRANHILKTIGIPKFKSKG